MRSNYLANGGNYEIDFTQEDATEAANSNAVMIGNLIVRKPQAEIIARRSFSAQTPPANGE